MSVLALCHEVSRGGAGVGALREVALGERRMRRVVRLLRALRRVEIDEARDLQHDGRTVVHGLGATRRRLEGAACPLVLRELVMLQPLEDVGVGSATAMRCSRFVVAQVCTLPSGGV